MFSQPRKITLSGWEPGYVTFANTKINKLFSLGAAIDKRSGLVHSHLGTRQQQPQPSSSLSATFDAIKDEFMAAIGEQDCPIKRCTPLCLIWSEGIWLRWLRSPHAGRVCTTQEIALWQGCLLVLGLVEMWFIRELCQWPYGNGVYVRENLFSYGRTGTRTSRVVLRQFFFFEALSINGLRKSSFIGCKSIWMTEFNFLGNFQMFG